jgi:hypothetical protein
MARNGSGVYSLPNPPFVFDTVIDETVMNSNLDDIAAAISQSISSDGQTIVTGNIPLNSHKFTGLSVGSVATDSLTLAQAQAAGFQWAGTAGGTADAITITPSPAIAAYVAGMPFMFIASANNTGAAALVISGLTSKAIQNGGAALVADDIVSGKMYKTVYDGTQFQISSVNLGSASTADVVGPVTATDSAVALFDGTTGKLLKDGVVIGTASGNLPAIGTKSATTTLAGLIEQATEGEGTTGTDDTVFPSVLTTKNMINTHSPSAKIYHVFYSSPARTSEGATSSGAYRTRLLNTELLAGVPGASLSSNQVTLPAGSYKVTWTMPFSAFGASNGLSQRLYNVTDAATAVRGGEGYGGSGDITFLLTGFGKITIAGTKIFELQYKSQTSASPQGLGDLGSQDLPAVGSNIMFEKVA